MEEEYNMALQNVTSELYLIFTTEGKINYNHNEVGMQTTYCDSCWTKEEFTIEQDWLDRLTELGVVDEELGINIPE